MDEFIIFFFSPDAPVNNPDLDLYTPLLAASCYDKVEVVRSLLEKNADVTTKESQDQTAIMLAVEYNNADVLKVRPMLF